MENLVENSNSSAFYFMAWASFIIAAIGSLVGIFFLPVDVWVKGYIVIAYLFTLTTSFVLAKTVRDKHETQRFVNRVKEAKTEKILADYERA
ncbi:MAG: YiaA/YiaB family inner membrane protein [Bacteroidota bacterium]